MSITRRQFLLGATSTATGLVVPTYLAKATQFLEETGSPLFSPRKISSRNSTPRTMVVSFGSFSVLMILNRTQ